MTDQPAQPYVPGPGFPPPYTQPPQKPRRRGLMITLVAVAGVLVLCVIGSVIVGVTQSSKPTKAAATATASKDPWATDVEATTAPTPEATTAAVVPLTASDIQVTVKVKKKDCFGSAGCNVEYKIEAGWPDDGQYECEVTYDVHGLEDTQTGTLDIHRDGTYEQDSYQAGETSSSKKKLTVKITDVDCS